MSKRVYDMIMIQMRRYRVSVLHQIFLEEQVVGARGNVTEMMEESM